MPTVIPTRKYYFEHRGYPLSVEEQAKDLAKVTSQFKNKKVPEKLRSDCDINPSKLFKVFLESKGRTYNFEYYKMLSNSLSSIITDLKKYYDRPRPKELAAAMGISFTCDDLETAQSPSYPSGHTIQAYVVAKLLSDQFPEHHENLHKIAEIISQSRIDAGVHFPTDVEYGREVAESLYNQIKEGLGGETPKDKPVYN